VNPSIKVELPQGASGTEQTRTTLALTLTKEGVLYLNGEPSDDAGLCVPSRPICPRTRTCRPSSPPTRWCPTATWSNLIDLVKRAGVRKFAINVDAAYNRVRHARVARWHRAGRSSYALGESKRGQRRGAPRVACSCDPLGCDGGAGRACHAGPERVLDSPRPRPARSPVTVEINTVEKQPIPLEPPHRNRSSSPRRPRPVWLADGPWPSRLRRFRPRIASSLRHRPAPSPRRRYSA